MKDYEKELINILSYTLTNKGEKYSVKDNIDLNELFNEAKAHCIEGLIYYYIKKEKLNISKKEIIYSLIMQKNRNFEIEKILKDFENMNIKMILLKGLYLKELYPNAELRTMGDADILVHEEDFNKVRDYFISRDFKEEELNNRVHREYISKDYISFEVHWDLINDIFLDIDTKEYTKEIWTNSKELNGENIRYIDINNNLVYLISHMATHIKYCGFGLRQLYDLCLLINKEKENIHWNLVINKLDKLGIKYFSITVFNTINRLFAKMIPDKVINIYKITEIETNLFIENVINSGVHGRKKYRDGFEGIVRYSTDVKDGNLVKKVFRSYFPYRNDMGKEYEYTKKYPIALPYAWINYARKEGVIKKYGFIGSIRNAKELASVRRKRINLIKKMKLI